MKRVMLVLLLVLVVVVWEPLTLLGAIVLAMLGWR